MSNFTFNDLETAKLVVEQVIDGPRYTGKVKWFNNKEGYGFITVCDAGDFLSKDIFVHYSSICVENSQYKYLVQGEYVEFNLIKVNSDKHDTQAVNISGIKGGSLMCETKRDLNYVRKPVSSQFSNNESSLNNGEHEQSRPPKTFKTPRPRDQSDEQKTNREKRPQREQRPPREQRQPVDLNKSLTDDGFKIVRKKNRTFSH